MYILKNYMEEIVEEKLQDILSKYKDVCKCEKCVLDVKALALNHLPTRYGVTEKGKVFAKLDAMDNQLKIDVTNQLIQAIEIVCKNPHKRGE